MNNYSTDLGESQVKSMDWHQALGEAELTYSYIKPSLEEIEAEWREDLDEMFSELYWLYQTPDEKPWRVS